MTFRNVAMSPFINTKEKNKREKKILFYWYYSISLLKSLKRLSSENITPSYEIFLAQGQGKILPDKENTYNSVNGWQSYTLLLLINFPYFQPNKPRECIITWDSSLQSVKSSLTEPLVSPWLLHLSSPTEAGCGSC